MVKCKMLLSEFGNCLGANCKIFKDIDSFKCIKTTPKISKHKHLQGN